MAKKTKPKPKKKLPVKKVKKPLPAKQLPDVAPGGMPASVAALVSADAEKPKDADLAKVREKAKELVVLYRRVETGMSLMKQLTDEISELETKTLPDMFTELKIKNISLEAEGNDPPVEFVRKPFYSAGIKKDWTDEQKNEAYQYLIEQKAGHLIKTSVSADFGAGELGKSKKMIAALKKLKIEYDASYGVHGGALDRKSVV